MMMMLAAPRQACRSGSHARASTSRRRAARCQAHPGGGAAHAASSRRDASSALWRRYPGRCAPLPAVACAVDAGEVAGAPVALPLPELEEIRVALKGRTEPIALYQPVDVDAVLDQYVEAESLGSDPYWARLWPAAVALSEEVSKHPEIVRGLHVGVLGCGLGLEGLAAALAGARRVTLLDREATALAVALRSASAAGFCSHGVAAMEPIDVPVAPECAKALRARFGISQTRNAAAYESTAHAQGDVVRAELFDWNHVDLQCAPRFDVLLASDVIYESGAVCPLVNLIPQLLRPPTRNARNELRGGVLLAGDPPHRTPANRAAFLAAIKESCGMHIATRKVHVRCVGDGGERVRVDAGSGLLAPDGTRERLAVGETGEADEAVVLMGGRLPARKGHHRHRHHHHHHKAHRRAHKGGDHALAMRNID